MANLYVPPEAPLILHAGAAALLFLHIGGASLGMASGVVAIVAPKGQRLHRVAGNVFFVSMLVMTVIAAGVAPFLDEGRWTNTIAGLFTFYLVATAWATVRRKPGEIGLFEKAAFLVPAGIVATAVGLAVIHAGTPRFAAFATVFVFAGLTALAAACDLRMILRGGVSGVQRIARHLWRMSAALAIALGSFFLGQQKFLPEVVQGSPILALPMVAALAIMAYWLVRYRFPKAFRRRPKAALGARVAGEAS